MKNKDKIKEINIRITECLNEIDNMKTNEGSEFAVNYLKSILLDVQSELKNINTIKMINISGIGWLDRVNGNSYFSARVSFINGDIKEIFKIPFQYGYGDTYIYESLNELEKNGLISSKLAFNNQISIRELKEQGYEIITHFKDKCTKKDVIEFVK